jgi:uncharacterized protein (TIGR02246 family)
MSSGRPTLAILVGTLACAVLAQDEQSTPSSRSSERSDDAMSTTQILPADDAAIRGLVDDLGSAWSRGDAAGMPRLFQHDGTFTNVFGTVHFGRAAFEERHRYILTNLFKGAEAAMQIRRLHLVRPDVALVDVDCQVRGVPATAGLPASPDGRGASSLLLVLTKDAGEWSIAAFHNVGVPPTAAAR